MPMDWEDFGDAERAEKRGKEIIEIKMRRSEWFELRRKIRDLNKLLESIEASQ